MDPYTHTYEFRVGQTGERWIDGECEFNTDGVASYKIVGSSDPLPRSTLGHFLELMDLLHKLYKDTGGVRKILIKRKVA